MSTARMTPREILDTALFAYALKADTPYEDVATALWLRHALNATPLGDDELGRAISDAGEAHARAWLAGRD